MVTSVRGAAGALSDWTKCRQPLRALRRSAAREVADMGGGADGGGDDAGLVDVLAAQRLDDAPPRQHDDLIAQPLKFRRVGGIDDDRRSRTRNLPQDAIDFRAGADVHALRRFVGDDQARLREQARAITTFC